MNNQAAWCTAAKTRPLKVDSAPEAKAGPNELVIKNAYVAVNPVDWKVQDTDPFSQKYPLIFGRDVAGEVVEVGEGVTRFSKGQRVISHALGAFLGGTRACGFQLYTVASQTVTATIPDSLSYEKAVVLPLALSTAIAGLYQKDYLGLPYPTIDYKPTGQTILVWGGSSSVGSTAIQLAKASGLEVISTASSKNLGYVESLGAKKVFDYSKPNVVDKILSALEGSNFVGAYDAISSEDTVSLSAEIVHKLGGGKVATVLSSGKNLPSDVKALQVVSLTIATSQQDVGNAIWGQFVFEALAKGLLVAKPDPLVLEGGLDKIQEGMDLLKQGVSATKIVIEL